MNYVFQEWDSSNIQCFYCGDNNTQGKSVLSIQEYFVGFCRMIFPLRDDAICYVIQSHKSTIGMSEYCLQMGCKENWWFQG